MKISLRVAFLAILSVLLVSPVSATGGDLPPAMQELKRRTEGNFQLVQLLHGFVGACLEPGATEQGFLSYVRDTLRQNVKSSPPYELASGVKLTDGTTIAMFYDVDYEKCCVGAVRETKDMSFSVEDTAYYIETTFRPNAKKRTFSNGS